MTALSFLAGLVALVNSEGYRYINKWGRSSLTFYLCKVLGKLQTRIHHSVKGS